MIVSENDGLTWTKKSRFGARDSNESTLCKLKNGQIIAATRTHSDHHVKLCELSKFGELPIVVNRYKVVPLTL